MMLLTRGLLVCLLECLLATFVWAKYNGFIQGTEQVDSNCTEIQAYQRPIKFHPANCSNPKFPVYQYDPLHIGFKVVYRKVNCSAPMNVTIVLDGCSLPFKHFMEPKEKEVHYFVELLGNESSLILVKDFKKVNFFDVLESVSCSKNYSRFNNFVNLELKFDGADQGECLPKVILDDQYEIFNNYTWHLSFFKKDPNEGSYTVGQCGEYCFWIFINTLVLAILFCCSCAFCCSRVNKLKKDFKKLANEEQDSESEDKKDSKTSTKGKTGKKASKKTSKKPKESAKKSNTKKSNTKKSTTKKSKDTKAKETKKDKKKSKDSKPTKSSAPTSSNTATDKKNKKKK